MRKTRTLEFRLRRRDGLYLHPEGGWTNKQYARVFRKNEKQAKEIAMRYNCEIEEAK